MRALEGVCECGCGTAIGGRWRPSREERRFALGHSRRRFVVVFCRGKRVRAYVHDEEAFCTGCGSWIPVVI